jgi:hypothetical protein
MKNKKSNNSIKGFEELFEVYHANDENYLREKAQEQDRNYDQYELQHFLEQENVRLGLIESFLTKKIPSKKNFSQTEKLIKHQVDRKIFLLEKTIPLVSKLNSSFQQNLALLFNAHFS